ncbi:MAG: thiol-disulfide oxidoreductase DCC family protein [Ferrimicrobium sp.]
MTETPTVVYDDSCTLCRIAKRHLTWWSPTTIELQGVSQCDLEALGIASAAANAALVLVVGDRRYEGIDAIAAWAHLAGGPYSILGWILSHRPFAAVARRTYSIVARNRHQLSRPIAWLERSNGLPRSANTQIR